MTGCGDTKDLIRIRWVGGLGHRERMKTVRQIPAQQAVPAEAIEMGKRGREYVLAHYSRRSQAQALERVLEGVIAKR